jgi:secreted PhoX family phosphatase
MEVQMFNNRMSRREFLKRGFLAVLAILTFPILKMLRMPEKVSHKDARYYKNLAG